MYKHGKLGVGAWPWGIPSKGNFRPYSASFSFMTMKTIVLCCHWPMNMIPWQHMHRLVFIKVNKLRRSPKVLHHVPTGSSALVYLPMDFALDTLLSKSKLFSFALSEFPVCLVLFTASLYPSILLRWGHLFCKGVSHTGAPSPSPVLPCQGLLPMEITCVM